MVMTRHAWLCAAALTLPSLVACGASHRTVVVGSASTALPTTSVSTSASTSTTVVANAEGPTRAVTASGGEVLVVPEGTAAALGLRPQQRMRADAQGRVVVQEGAEVFVEVPEGQRGPIVVIVEGAGGQTELLAVPSPPPPATTTYGGVAELSCGGNERIRVHNRHVRGGDHAAIVATGNCVVEVEEAVVVGSPAIVVRDNARVVVVESRVTGDVLIEGRGEVPMRGSVHRGRRLGGPQPLASLE